MALSDLRKNRVVSVILWVVQALTALMFLFAALGKFSGATASVESFNALGTPDWVRYAVGGLEVIGAVALLIAPLCGLAALAFGLLMIGAVLTQVFAVGSGWMLPLVMLIIVAIIAWGRWPRTASLLSRLRPRSADQTA